ncbi:MAG: hypothetical protein AAF138_11195 [Planctomycetota bacterium]
MKATKAPVPESVAAPRRRFVLLPIAIYGVTLALIVLLWWIGAVRHDNPGRYFGEGRPGTTATVLAFLLAGIVAGQTWWDLRPRRFAWFWLVASLGFIGLAIDDQFKVHEAIGDWITETTKLQGPTDHVDDIVVLFYAPIAGLVALPFCRLLLRLRGMIVYLGVGFVCFMVMALWDMRLEEEYDYDPYAMEESFKLLSAVSIAVAMMSARSALGVWGPNKAYAFDELRTKRATPPDP